MARLNKAYRFSEFQKLSKYLLGLHGRGICPSPDLHLHNTILTYGAEPFLRSCQLCSYSRTWKYKLWSSSLCSFHQSPFTSSLFGPNILLSTLFSNTLSLCSSRNVRDQVSHPYRTTGKIIVSYILMFMFLDTIQHKYGKCEARKTKFHCLISKSVLCEEHF
jgi:hypothetical protein